MIQIAALVALIVIFIYTTMREGEIFDFVNTWFWALNNKLKKPLFRCPICMTPWWGSIILWIGTIAGFWDLSVYEWFFILAIAGGLNCVLAPMLPE